MNVDIGKPSGENVGLHFAASSSHSSYTVAEHTGIRPCWYGSTRLGEAPGPGLSEAFLWPVFAEFGMATEAKHSAPGGKGRSTLQGCCNTALKENAKQIVCG